MSAAIPKPVAPGERLNIRAATWNAIGDLLRASKQGQPKDPRRESLRWGGVVEAYALNDTGADLREYKPATVTDAGGYELPTNDTAWQRQPLLTIDAPGATTDFVVVTLEAIPDGQIGRVAVAGVVLCDVDTTAGSDYGTPAVGDTDRLTGGTSGPIRILHVPASVGSTKRCIVNLSDQTAGTDGEVEGGPSDGVDEAGFTSICKVTSGGNMTDIKRRVKYGNMFRCESVDECCLSAWWCIQNEQVELTLACCTPATITRVIRLALTSKTGDCADLPDLVHLVHTGGTDLTWTTGGLEYWGSRQYSATLTLSCSGGNLKADLVISDFTGGSSTTIPCDLTSTGVALGTFTYSGTESNGCGGTTDLSGTVDIAVSSWETAGVAETGVIEFAEDEVPPHDATGPWKTEAEAEVCCVETFILECCDDVEMAGKLTVEFSDLTCTDGTASCGTYGFAIDGSPVLSTQFVEDTPGIWLAYATVPLTATGPAGLTSALASEVLRLAIYADCATVNFPPSVSGVRFRFLLLADTNTNCVGQVQLNDPTSGTDAYYFAETASGHNGTGAFITSVAECADGDPFARPLELPGAYSTNQTLAGGKYEVELWMRYGSRSAGGACTSSILTTIKFRFGVSE